MKIHMKEGRYNMSKEEHGRDWGYASYDINHPDDEGLIYTSYVNSGKVNQYHNNGDVNYNFDIYK